MGSVEAEQGTKSGEEANLFSALRFRGAFAAEELSANFPAGCVTGAKASLPSRPPGQGYPSVAVPGRAPCATRAARPAGGVQRCRRSGMGRRQLARTDRAEATARVGLGPASDVQRCDARSVVSPAAWPGPRPHCRARSTRVPGPSRRAQLAQRNPGSSAPASRAGDQVFHLPLDSLERQIAEPVPFLLGRDDRGEQLGSRSILSAQQADPGCHYLTHVPEPSCSDGLGRKLLQVRRKGHAVHFRIIGQGRATGKVFGQSGGDVISV